MPKLWDETIEAHRSHVRDAILDAAAGLVAEQGLLAVTMSRVAQRAGIGRATLYKYFADVEAVVDAWHQRQIAGHLEQLAALRDRDGDVEQRLEAVLEAFAFIAHRRRSHEHPGREVAVALHQGLHATEAQRHVHGLVKDLLVEAAREGVVRGDVEPDELARYCLGALAAAGDLPSAAAVRRLVAVTLSGLRA